MMLEYMALELIDSKYEFPVKVVGLKVAHMIGLKSYYSMNHPRDRTFFQTEGV